MKVSATRKRLVVKPKSKTTRKSIPRPLSHKTKTTPKTRKSILDKIVPKKTQKSFGIYTVVNDEILFVRFIAKQDDEFKVYFETKFVKKVDECSKFVSMESAKQKIEELKRKYKLELKAIECGKLKNK